MTAELTTEYRVDTMTLCAIAHTAKEARVTRITKSVRIVGSHGHPIEEVRVIFREDGSVVIKFPQRRVKVTDLRLYNGATLIGVS